tara:strand:- start:20847 stop:21419 length:573 start_codon:yes stop_codon:yes gene_type:complete
MPKNNTIIHKTFSKKDLLRIIDDFQILIGVGEQHTKSVVANTLWDILVKMEYLYCPPDNKYLVKNILELRQFLKEPNPRKPFSVKERDRHILIAKKINQYCELGFSLPQSVYTDIQHLYNDADKISPYGDVPIVRKTLRKLMNDPKKLYNVKPVISPHIQHDLDVKKSLQKKHCIMKCHISHGKFVIKFD